MRTTNPQANKPRQGIDIGESPSVLEVYNNVKIKTRLLFFTIALFPLIVPYQFLSRPEWFRQVFSPTFISLAVLSIVALGCSGFFFWLALAGLSSTYRFENSRAKLICISDAPLLPRRRMIYDFGEVLRVRLVSSNLLGLRTQYDLKLDVADGKSYWLGSTIDLDEGRAAVDKLKDFMDQEKTSQ